MNNNMNHKTCTVVVRCMNSDKERIKRKANQSNKSVSQFVLDSCIAATERKSDLQKRSIRKKVMLQEGINRIQYILNQKDFETSNDENRMEIVQELMKMEGMLYA